MAKLARKHFLVYVNTDFTKTTKTWELVGKGSETLDLMTGIEKDATKDVYGQEYLSIQKSAGGSTIEVTPFSEVADSELFEGLIELVRNEDYITMGSIEVMIVYGFLESTSGGYPADTYSSCSVIPESIGGQNNIEMPFEITLAGVRTKGTVVSNDWRTVKPTFTPTV